MLPYDLRLMSQFPIGFPLKSVKFPVSSLKLQFHLFRPGSTSPFAELPSEAEANRIWGSWHVVTCRDMDKGFWWFLDVVQLFILSSCWFLRPHSLSFLFGIRFLLEGAALLAAVWCGGFWCALVLALSCIEDALVPLTTLLECLSDCSAALRKWQSGHHFVRVYHFFCGYFRVFSIWLE